MAALITVADLLARPGFGNVDESQAEAVIDDASALVADVAAPVVLTAQTLPKSIVPVLVSMVGRGLHNPRGLQSEQLGDYGWQGGGTAAGLYLTREETRIVRRAVGKLGVGTVTLEGDLPLPPGVPGPLGYEDRFLESL
ncbi:hypothetical protein [Actinocorallia longicatena]|uniref:Phage protein Gp19/Gp15/Gp42 n=1 Tax=Actinocorallia longicatena TaxID=111803 RepID=A0ABP6QHI5_9ACTN